MAAIDPKRAPHEQPGSLSRHAAFSSVDHQTPPGVSLAQYRDYLALMWEYTERAV